MFNSDKIIANSILSKFGLNRLFAISGLILLSVFIVGIVCQVSFHLSERLVNPYIICAILLMPLNILCETLKLYYKLHSEMSLMQITKQVCKGFAVNQIIPFGIGQYAGRIIQTVKNQNAQILNISFMSSMIQSLCNLSFGILLAYPIYNQIAQPDAYNFISASICSALIIGILILLIYINSNSIALHDIFDRIKIPDRFHLFRCEQSYQDLTVIFILSVIRYSIYCIQTLLVLYSFHQLDLNIALQVVSLLFMTLSLIKLPGLFSLLSRSAIAVFIFSMVQIPGEQAIFLVSFIYLLNILVPAMFGVYYMFEHSLLKQQ